MKTSTPEKTTPSLNKKLRILILEDEPNDVILIKNELKKLTLPHEIKTAENKKDFLLALQDFKPDIILSDYFLPMVTGIDVLKLARRRLPHIPFILVTGSINEETAVECMKAGADDYILKNHLERLGGVIRNVLERKRAQEALRKSEERYRSLFENMLEGYAYCRMLFENDRPQDFIYLNVNSAFEKLTGLKNVIGRKVSEVIPGIKESNPELFEIYGRVALIGSPERFETYLDALGIWLSISVFSPGKGYFVAVFDNITERKRAEETLRERDELLAETGKIAKMGGWEFDPVTSKGTWTTEVARIHDLDPEQETNAEIGISFYHDEYRKQIEHAIQETIELAKPYDLELEMVSAKGIHKWIRTIGHPVIEGGKVVKVRGSFQDITDHKRAEEKIKEGEEKLHRSLLGTIRTIALITELRDPYTAGHQRRVTNLACAIAQEMGFSKEQIEGLYTAGVLHDMGKINVPSEILSKPGRLSELEYNLVKTHVKAGYEILKDIEFPWPVAEIVLQHHERIDGSGYPSGLTGEKIHIVAKILAVADVVEAVSSYRPYRPALGIDKALEEISQKSGFLYDAEAVDACLKVFAEKGFKFE